MKSATLVGAVTFIYLFCTVLYMSYLAFRSHRAGVIASIACWTGLAMQTSAILWRWVESYQLGVGHAPLSNMYESLVFFSWCIALLYLVWEWRLKARIIGAFVVPFAFIFNAYASLAPGISAKIDPLIPALQSNWLHAHVITCFLSYASFAFSCGVSAIYLFKANQKPGMESGMFARFPSLDDLEALIYKGVVLGFPLLTIGIVTGAAWANYAWGSYWSWDPKETWSLITWFLYLVFLHARVSREWRGKRIAWLSVIGFLGVIFTYFGVNYVLSGLHSYA
ncbi:MAG TPA: c-type cytochrome biogenesis protein CcsB [Thermodesulfobacteriota bacterium]|nr:c-type cytochrome biogenesis protein CcsB [Thermodesulfobacteriota bacterium]